MSRRLFASLSVLAAALLAVAVIALSGGGGGGGSAATAATAAAPAPAAVSYGTTGARTGRMGFAHRGGHGFGMLRFFGGLVLKSSAERLGVTPAKLRAAVKAVAEQQFAKKAAQAKLTADEIAALKACRKGLRGLRHGGAGSSARGTCDRATARAAITKLRALPKPDLAALKTELSDALGAELGITGAKVLEAARAELAARLDQGVKMGFLTADARTKALACFDAPASCDVKALHRALRRGHLRGGHRGQSRRAHRFGTLQRRQ